MTSELRAGMRVRVGPAGQTCPTGTLVSIFRRGLIRYGRVQIERSSPAPTSGRGRRFYPRALQPIERSYPLSRIHAEGQS